MVLLQLSYKPSSVTFLGGLSNRCSVLFTCVNLSFSLIDEACCRMDPQLCWERHRKPKICHTLQHFAKGTLVWLYNYWLYSVNSDMWWEENFMNMFANSPLVYPRSFFLWNCNPKSYTYHLHPVVMLSNCPVFGQQFSKAYMFIWAILH